MEELALIKSQLLSRAAPIIYHMLIRTLLWPYNCIYTETLSRLDKVCNSALYSLRLMLPRRVLPTLPIRYADESSRN